MIKTETQQNPFWLTSAATWRFSNYKLSAAMKNIEWMASLLYAVVRLNYHFRGLTNLVELDLSQNGLKEVPSGAVIDCKYLMRLSLRGNPGIRQVRSLTQFLSVCFLVKNNRLTSSGNSDHLKMKRLGFENQNKCIGRDEHFLKSGSPMLTTSFY